MKRSVLLGLFVITLILSALAWYAYRENLFLTDNGIVQGGKQYIGTPEECQRIRFVCDQGLEYFSDEAGCGCQPISGGGQNLTNSSQYYCTTEDRKAEACTLQYEPVCGWFGQEIQCIRYPCAGTYGNGCQACADTKVEYWTRGECPQ